MFGLGPTELVFTFLVVFLLFGPKALPEIAKGLGQAIKLFKKEVKNISDDIEIDSQEKIVSSAEKMKTSDDYDPSQKKRDWRPDSNQG